MSLGSKSGASSRAASIGRRSCAFACQRERDLGWDERRVARDATIVCSHANGSQQSCQVKDGLLKGHEESCRMGIRAFMTRADAEGRPRLGAALVCVVFRT